MVESIVNGQFVWLNVGVCHWLSLHKLEGTEHRRRSGGCGFDSCQELRKTFIMILAACSLHSNAIETMYDECLIYCWHFEIRRVEAYMIRKRIQVLTQVCALPKSV